MALTPEEIEALEQQLADLRAEVSALGAEGAARAAELDILEDALTRGGEAAAGVASAMARMRREIAETSDASRTLARGTERLIRTLTGVERGADGAAAGFARMISEGEAVGTAFHIMGKEIAETLTPTNLAIAGFKKFVEASTVLTLSVDNATAAFAKSTGTGLKYRDVIKSVEYQNRDLGVTADQAATAVGALQGGFSEFLMMSEKAQKDLAGTVAQFETFGVSADNTTGFLQAVTRTTGRTRTGALKLQKSIMGTAKAFGDDLNKVMQEASTIMPKLAIHGRNMEKVFDDLYSASKRTGMGMQDIVSLSEQFDTFESAADAAGNLNAVLASMGGTPLVDTMEILETTNPAERMELFRNAISQSVGDFESLDYWSQKALASTLGMSSEQLLMMMNQEEQVDALEAAMTKAGLRQDEMVELQKAGRDFATEAKILAMSFAVSLQGPLNRLKDTMGAISGFLNSFNESFGWMAGIAKVGGMLIASLVGGTLMTLVGSLMMRGSNPLMQTYASDVTTHTLLTQLLATSTTDAATGAVTTSASGVGASIGKGTALTIAIAAAVMGVTKLISDIERDKAAGEEEKAKHRAQIGTALAVVGGIGGAVAGSFLMPGAGTAAGASAGIGMGTAIGGLLGIGGGAALGSSIGGGMAEGGITQGPSLAGEAGPEAVVPLPNGRTIPVQLNTAAFEPLINKLDEVASRITDAVDRNQAVLLQSDLESAGFRRGRTLALDSR